MVQIWQNSSMNWGNRIGIETRQVPIFSLMIFNSKTQMSQCKAILIFKSWARPKRVWMWIPKWFMWWVTKPWHFKLSSSVSELHLPALIDSQPKHRFWRALKRVWWKSILSVHSLVSRQAEKHFYKNSNFHALLDHCSMASNLTEMRVNSGSFGTIRFYPLSTINHFRIVISIRGHLHQFTWEMMSLIYVNRIDIRLIALYLWTSWLKKTPTNCSVIQVFFHQTVFGTKRTVNNYWILIWTWPLTQIYFLRIAREKQMSLHVNSAVLIWPQVHT